MSDNQWVDFLNSGCVFQDIWKSHLLPLQPAPFFPRLPHHTSKPLCKLHTQCGHSRHPPAPLSLARPTFCTSAHLPHSPQRPPIAEEKLHRNCLYGGGAGLPRFAGMRSELVSRCRAPFPTPALGSFPLLIGVPILHARCTVLFLCGTTSSLSFYFVG
jgi:hypothetical protein